MNFPVALEGALKLKEISYIHAEGYPAAEMKHGPIALIDEKMPVLVIATEDEYYSKIFSNALEVKSRGGRIISIVFDDDDAGVDVAERRDRAVAEKRHRCPSGTVGRSGWHDLFHAFLGAHSHSTSSLQTLLRGVLMRLLLASSSPRRRELLSLLVSEFEFSAPDIDESPRTAERPVDYVARLAREKAKAGAADKWVILGSDTTVAMGQEILGKPRDRQDAAAMLRALSGNTHEVHTAVAAAYGDSIETVTCTTSVLFTELSEAAIEQYLLTDEPWDKAGAYAIQGYAGAFVSQIRGSYSAVVGLPLCETRALLIEAGVPVRHG